MRDMRQRQQAGDDLDLKVWTVGRGEPIENFREPAGVTLGLGVSVLLPGKR